MLKFDTEVWLLSGQCVERCLAMFWQLYLVSAVTLHLVFTLQNNLKFCEDSEVGVTRTDNFRFLKEMIFLACLLLGYDYYSCLKMSFCLLKHFK